jgi:hypothetical protein
VEAVVAHRPIREPAHQVLHCLAVFESDGMGELPLHQMVRRLRLDLEDQPSEVEPEGGVGAFAQ